MNIAFVIYDGMTTLDFIGAYDALTRLHSMGFMPGVRWDICARTAQVRDHSGLCVEATCVSRPLSGYNLVVVPGGFTARKLMHDDVFVEWVRTAADARTKASVCTGSLLLGAAGFLKEKRATTHPTAYDLLAPLCARVVRERVVDEGDVITARGVTSSISLGLYLVQRIAGQEVRARIQQQMDYPYEE
jgi:cyclohexyl-isocyanide hydratase